jgi:hypothetical protein
MATSLSSAIMMLLVIFVVVSQHGGACQTAKRPHCRESRDPEPASYRLGARRLPDLPMSGNS